MPDAVVTRFAPSPTGFLHIGGARTALFNWLYARAKGGTMLLRIEDTDRQRSTPEAIEAIKDGLHWLELDWDGDAVHQFARADGHRAVAEALLDAGHAYPCYASAEELTQMREQARAEGRPPIYDGRWRDRDPADAPPGVDPVIRLKAPRDGETIIDDQVQGRVVFANKDLDDFVILRSDGSPTYMLSVVVDDHDMGVTHIIRGDDHLTNAARQTLIFQAMDWPVPEMAHIPLIHGADGAKLSKRHGALGVDAYRDMGYLPAAMRNYLARLGWSHGDDEIFSTDDMIRWFDLADIGKSAARFDFDKLNSINGHYMRTTADDELLWRMVDLLPHLEGGDALAATLNGETRDKLLLAMPGLKERAKNLLELIDGARFIFDERPLGLEPKAAKILSEEARADLARLIVELEATTPWTVDTLEACIRAFAEANDLKLGKVAQPLRAALTGRTTSPGVFDVLAVLGREESLARLRDQAIS